MNYLESPGFYVGLLPLLAAAQLWRGSPAERRLLVVGVVGVLLYFLFPVFRLAAFGFASPYFRATTLWVSIGLLWIGMRGFDRLIEHGADRRALVAGTIVVLALLAAATGFADYAWVAYAVKVAIIVGAWFALLFALGRTHLRSRLVAAALVLALVELVVIAWPSYWTLRNFAAPTADPANDVTLPALEAIRRADRSPFYRVEKTYKSKSEADAAMQGYRGVQSYYYHGRAVIDFHRNMDLMRRFGAFVPINLTNWTAAPQDRYFLHSVLGVRYLVTKTPVDWPGFELLARGEGWLAYRNELALPLGFVQSQQVTRQEMQDLDRLPPDRQRWFKDAALVNAVVLDAPMPTHGTRFDLAGLASGGSIDVPSLYAKPALELQRTGLAIEHFRNDHIAGRIAPARDGILVFTIPAYRGWSLRIDGQPVPLMTANFGMLAAPVKAGPQQVELRYELPGLRAGFALCAAGILALFLAVRRQRRRHG
jgi:uncharacterized membrane protein YfhO